MATVEKRIHIADKIGLFKALGVAGVDSIASAISLRLGTQVNVGSLSAGMLRVSTLAEETTAPDNAAFGICVKVSGACSGHGVFLLPYHHALTLVDAVMGSSIGARKRFDELSTSALQEIARLIVSAQLSAFSSVCDLPVESEKVTLAVDMAFRIVSSIASSAENADEEAMVVAMRFEQADWNLEATFLFIPDEGVVEKLLCASNIPPAQQP